MQYVFGDCALDPDRRELIRRGKAVAIGPKDSPTANFPGVYPPTDRGARGRRGRDGRSGTGRAALPRIHSGRNFW